MELKGYRKCIITDQEVTELNTVETFCNSRSFTIDFSSIQNDVSTLM